MPFLLEEGHILGVDRSSLLGHRQIEEIELVPCLSYTLDMRSPNQQVMSKGPGDLMGRQRTTYRLLQAMKLGSSPVLHLGGQLLSNLSCRQPALAKISQSLSLPELDAEQRDPKISRSSLT
jgi:hypothetical protein